jgi:NitT/TauT family transport system permease protein
MGLRLLAIRFLSVASMFLIWAAISSFLPPMLMPNPWVVGHRLWQLCLNGQFWHHAYGTVSRVVIGFALAFVVSIALGVAMGLRKTAAVMFESYVLVGLTVPGLCWSVLAIMWFGVTEFAPIFSIFVVVLPMLTLNMWQGTKSLDKDLMEMARTFNFSRRSMLFDVILPQLLPFCLAGARLGFALGWKVVVLSELFGLTSGVGYMINRAFSNYSMADVLAWTLGFTLIMFVLEYVVFLPVERRLVRWRTATAT